MLSSVLLIAGIVALAYQVFALLAAIIYKERSRLRYVRPVASFSPPISILKPVRGLDEGFMEAIRSHAQQQYPEYELLFGVHDLEDPAVPVIRQLMADHPERAIRLIQATTQAPNNKVGILIDLARQARYPVLLVNDADITVPADYLRRVVAPLYSADIGLVTCLYRATASSIPGRWEALGIATDFIPSTLVAPIVGVKEFGLGSTLCFRADDLKAIGGFDAIREFVADDYQLAKRITALGRGGYLSEVVVDTTLSDPDWTATWRHQIRWARTIRVSRRGGYAGLPVTHAGVWVLANLLAGNYPIAITLLAARLTMGVTGGFVVLRHWPALLAAPLIPIWDLWAFAVWLVGTMGDTVHWRNGRIKLHPDGRMS